LPKPQVQLSIFDELNNTINGVVNISRQDLLAKAYVKQGDKNAYQSLKS
jgi:hypothetical protein